MDTKLYWPLKVSEIRQIARTRRLQTKKGGTFRLVVWFSETPYGEFVLRPKFLRVENETVYGTFEFIHPVTLQKFFQAAPYLYCLKAFSFSLQPEQFELVTNNFEIKYYDDKEREKIKKDYEKLREKEPWLNEEARKNLQPNKSVPS